MTQHPIPEKALDDRLGYVGTAGSGKTYNAGSGVERLLHRKSRVIICDPLGVWYGLRVAPNGRDRGFDVAIFGGQHGDLPLTEQAGALIGETVAGMAESCILDLSQLGTKAAERRFMLASLTALYKHANGEPVHVIFDEADMWAPQRLMDRDGDAARLLGMMETIVRRGRVKGFIPWLITQRPAVLSKDVLSQVDGLVAFKLTSSQDRDAIGNWVEGQADKEQWREIWRSLPTLERGQGVIWLPSRGILKTAQFPKKATFDSSATPKRGQKVKAGAKLKPLNLGALKERLATVEEKEKANDPVKLRGENGKLNAEIVKLNGEIVKLQRDAGATKIDPKAIEAAEKRGFEQAKKKLTRAAERELRQRTIAFLDQIKKTLQPVGEWIDSASATARQMQAELDKAVAFEAAPAVPRPAPSVAPQTPSRAKIAAPIAGDGSLSKPQLELLTSLAWWSAMGHAEPTKAQVAAIAGWKVKGSHLRNRLGELKAAGLIDYPQSGRISLTPQGGASAPSPNMATTLVGAIRAMLTQPQQELFNALLQGGSGMIMREDLAGMIGWEAKGSHLRNRLAELSNLEIVAYPQKGAVALQEWVFSDAR